MANIYSIKSGNASDPTVWSGGAVPASGDRVLISAGHTVTLDGAYEWGDDNSNTITINTISTTVSITVRGTLRASRTVSSSLTCRGSLRVEITSTGIFGFLDIGTEADPIPLGVNFALYINKTSSAPAVGKYTATCTGNSGQLVRVSFHGHYRRRNAKLVSAVAAGATAAVVDDATGWQVGDTVVFASTTVSSNAPTNYDQRVLTSVNQVTGQIGFAALTYAHAAKCPVGNFTSNVVIALADMAYASYFYASASNTSGGAAEGYIHIHNTALIGNGVATYGYGGLLVVLKASSYPAGGRSIDTLRSLAFYADSSAAGPGAQFATSGSLEPYQLDDCAFFNKSSNSSSACINCWTTATFKAGERTSVVYLGGGTGTSTALYFSGALSGSMRVDVFGSRQYAINLAQGAVNFDWISPVIGPASPTYYIQVGGTGSGLRITSPDANSSFPSAGTKYLIRYGNGTLSSAEISDLRASPNVVTALNNAINSSPGSSLLLRNKGADVTVQELYTTEGQVVRDNSFSYRGQSSIRFDTFTSLAVYPYALKRTVSFQAVSGVTYFVVGYVRKSANYGALTRPSVAVSGEGLATQEFVMSDSAGVWERFEMSVTQSTGILQTITITMSAQSRTAGAQAWFDGIPDSPFVDTVRHFGYVFDANVYRTPDPRITMTEATALALPVVVDHVAQTITVSGAVTNAQLFQACIADLCQTANLSRAVHITSSDGADFTTSYTVVGKTNVTGAFTDATGRAVTITAPALIAGSRVQVYNQSTGVELYNGVLAGTGLTLAANYSVPQIIRLRAEHATKLPLETVGVLSSSGVSFLDVQDEDTVYIAAGIDGSTVTEFAADGTNIEVDINDPDGITTVQRLYAWMQHYQTTEEGIRSAFFGALYAIDDANFVIDQSLVNMKLDNVSSIPLRVIGGHLARKDGSTVIATNSGSIQMDPGKAYAISVSGSGGTATVDNAAIAAAVWGNATRTLTVAAGLTSAQEAKIDAIKTKTDNLPTTPADQTTLNQVQTKIDATL